MSPQSLVTEVNDGAKHDVAIIASNLTAADVSANQPTEHDLASTTATVLGDQIEDVTTELEVDQPATGSLVTVSDANVDPAIETIAESDVAETTDLVGANSDAAETEANIGLAEVVEPMAISAAPEDELAADIELAATLPEEVNADSAATKLDPTELDPIVEQATGVPLDSKDSKDSQTADVLNSQLQPDAAKPVLTPPRPKAYFGVRMVSQPNDSLVRVVDADSPAARGGIRPGDVLVRFGKQKVTNFNELRAAVSGVAADDKVPVLVRRKGTNEVLRLNVQLRPATPQPVQPPSGK